MKLKIKKEKVALEKERLLATLILINKIIFYKYDLFIHLSNDTILMDQIK